MLADISKNRLGANKHFKRVYNWMENVNKWKKMLAAFCQKKKTANKLAEWTIAASYVRERLTEISYHLQPKHCLRSKRAGSIAGSWFCLYYLYNFLS